MGTLAMFQYTTSDIEENADILKTIILKALVGDGLIAPEIAEEWAVNHTLIIRKKSIFRTLTDRWKEEKDHEWYREWYWIVVKARPGTER